MPKRSELHSVEFTSPAFAGAYRRGRESRRAGEPRSACPYRDKRTARGSVTFSRVFRERWVRGWKDERDGRPLLVRRWPADLKRLRHHDVLPYFVDDSGELYVSAGGELVTVESYIKCKT